MGLALVPRPGVYETYWYVAAERQSIFTKRLRREVGPLTEDPIFLQYKFCNSFRAADRVSQDLLREVLYPGRAYGQEDTLLRVLLFRLFNKTSTWKFLESELGEVVHDTCIPQHLAELLDQLHQRQPLYGHAYIIPPVPGSPGPHKHYGHLWLIEQVMSSNLCQQICSAPSLEQLVNLLQALPGIGGFLSYQLAIDLCYSQYWNFDEDDYMQAGPGALRGIAKCFLNTGGASPAEVIWWMVKHQEQEFARLGLTPATLFGRRLHTIDCQGLFCETDKYCRVRFPELASGRVRMKSAYAPNPLPTPPYVFPPKWQLSPAQ